MSQIVDLDSSIELAFLAEGAANVVYRLLLPPPSPSISADIGLEGDSPETSTPPPSDIPMLRYDLRLENKLLRMRKDIPSAVPVIKSQQQFEDIIQPLIPRENTIEQTLARLPEALVQHCNTQLREIERLGSRKLERHGLYLNTDELYASLVTDMSASQHSELVSLEFKPKWLAQSPSAPEGSRKCRTCALRNMRNRERNRKGRTLETVTFCPFDLVSRDRVRVECAVDSILQASDHSAAVVESIRDRVIDFLHRNPLLKSLRDLQITLDHKGPLTGDTTRQEFLTAMTLRDCTLYIRVCIPRLMYSG